MRACLFRSLAVSLLFLCTAAAAVDAPDATFQRLSDGQLEVSFTPSDASGYNVYRDRAYLTTVRPARDADRFQVPAPLAGNYCLVAFVENASSATRYSPCSAATSIQASPDTDDSRNAPEPPPALRSAVYSEGVAELFWDIARNPAGRNASSYRVLRDGQPRAVISGRSVFEAGLDPRHTYRYTVTAIDRSGAESQPSTLTLTPTLEAPEEKLALDKLALQIVTQRVSVREGRAAPVSVAVSVERPAGDTRTVKLELLAHDDLRSHGLVSSLSRTTLPDGVNRAAVRLKLPVSLAPIQIHEHALTVKATIGQTSVTQDLTAVIRPTTAPDVYLLMGQSNMEGYSEPGSKDASAGGPDAPDSRIRQLHVVANNARYFTTDASYTDEAANIASPTFIPAEDPLHDRSYYGLPKSGTWVGPGLTFAKSALERTTADIYLVPAAWSATGFCEFGPAPGRAWNAVPYATAGLGGDLLLKRALTRLQITLRETGGILRGILWHQGGADSNDPRCYNTHRDNLAAMVAYIRKHAPVDQRGPSARGPDALIPFIVATASIGRDERADFSVRSTGRRIVDEAHRAVGSYIPHSDYINNDDLVPLAYPCGQTSCVHFGAAAMREQGRRFDAALRRIIAASD